MFIHESQAFDNQFSRSMAISNQSLLSGGLLSCHCVGRDLVLGRHILDDVSFRDSHGLVQPIRCIFLDSCPLLDDPFGLALPLYPPDSQISGSTPARTRKLWVRKISLVQLNSPLEELYVRTRVSVVQSFGKGSWVGITANVRARRNSVGFKMVLSGSPVLSMMKEGIPGPWDRSRILVFRSQTWLFCEAPERLSTLFYGGR